MKGGRKNLKKAAEEGNLTLEDGQSIVQVVSLRGSNLIEVMDQKGERSLALFPAKFQKSMWIKRGSFVVVDESGKEKALESGSKVACIVSQVLFYEQIRMLQKSTKWPEIFKSAALPDSKGNPNKSTSQQDDKKLDFNDGDDDNDEDDDDGLPPLEANMNRTRPADLLTDEDSNSGSDTDS